VRCPRLFTQQIEYVVGRSVSSLTGANRRPQPTSELWEHTLTSPWIEAAEVAQVAQGSIMLGHARRTWHFARQLARKDGAELDEEALLVAALLHDLGLQSPRKRRCFTLHGAEVARATASAAGADDARAKLVADAIMEHADALKPRTPEGQYLQAGSLLDVTGHRAWDIPSKITEEICCKWPRTGFYAELRGLWRNECHAVPRGRAAFASCPGAILQVARVANLPNCEECRDTEG
jgi:HD domain